MVEATNKEKIHFAVVGAGHIGKRHIEMIVRHPEADLIAVSDLCSKNELGLEGLEAPFYNSLEEMLAQHPEIDVVCIATPNGNEQRSPSLRRGGTHLRATCAPHLQFSKATNRRLRLTYRAIFKVATQFSAPLSCATL